MVSFCPSVPDNRAGLSEELILSFHDRRTDLVFAVFSTLAADKGTTGVAASEVIQALRQQGNPMSAWEVRGELTKLENMAAIELEESTARWRLPVSKTGESDSPVRAQAHNTQD